MIICLSCGENVTHKSNNRRNLCNESANPVFLFWKDLFMSKLDVEEIEAEDVVKELVEAHRMCRRCFSVIGRLLKMRKGVEENIKEAIIAVVLPNVRRKIQEPTTSLDIPAPKRPPPRL